MQISGALVCDNGNLEPEILTIGVPIPHQISTTILDRDCANISATQFAKIAGRQEFTMKAAFTTLIIIVGLFAPTLTNAGQVGILISETRDQQGYYLCTYRMADGSVVTLRNNSWCPGAINR